MMYPSHVPATLLVLVTSCLTSYINADAQSSGVANAQHEDILTQTLQQPLPQQQKQTVPQSSSPSASSQSFYDRLFPNLHDNPYYEFPFLLSNAGPQLYLDSSKPVPSQGASSEDPSNSSFQASLKRDSPRLVGKKRDIPRFVGKKSGDPGNSIDISSRDIPRFVGKRENQDFLDPSLSNIDVSLRGSPRFVGRKRESDPLEGGLDISSRGIPRFVGKRPADQSPFVLTSRDIPRFVGKRQLFAPVDVTSRGIPRFVGKRQEEDFITSDNSDTVDVDSRDYPRFVGKKRTNSPRFVGKKQADSPRFVGKKRAHSPRFVGKKRAHSPRFVGKKRAHSPRFVGKKRSSGGAEGEMERTARDSPKFVGKRASEISNSVHNHEHHIAKRAAADSFFVETRKAPLFVGKRPYRYSQREAPFFIGKRYNYYRSPGNTSPTPSYLSAHEFKETYRRSDPFFIGKRSPAFWGLDDDLDVLGEKRGESPRFVGKRDFPRFVGKRGAPLFVGKRGAPLFVGKRGVPMFVGKRGAPLFVGKRNAPWFVGKRGAPLFVGRRDAPRFVGKRELNELYNLSNQGDSSTYDIDDYLEESDAERGYLQLLETLSRLEAIKQLQSRLERDTAALIDKDNDDASQTGDIESAFER